MIFKVGDQIVDTNVTPVGLIFVDKNEAKVLADILASLKNGNTEFPIDGNGNWWFMTPAQWAFEDVDRWSVLTDEQKEILAKQPRLLRKLKFEL